MKKSHLPPSGQGVPAKVIFQRVRLQAPNRFKITPEVLFSAFWATGSKQFEYEFQKLIFVAFSVNKYQTVPKRTSEG